ncbi:hypothetical protein T484DRAFT_1808885 [Baffinella frigidus]|nr:hypothetical protein T484DRAFT_1808885 [Cryptophyta sp. CCMP2293]
MGDGSAKRQFLRRGEGRLGTSIPVPTSGGLSSSSSRGSIIPGRPLVLERPTPAGDVRGPFSDEDTSGTGENEFPPTYSTLFSKKKSQPLSATRRPASAHGERPDSERKAMDTSRSVDASSLSTNEGLRLRSMVKPMQLARGRNANSPPPAALRSHQEAGRDGGREGAREGGREGGLLRTHPDSPSASSSRTVSPGLVSAPTSIDLCQTPSGST